MGTTSIRSAEHGWIFYHRGPCHGMRTLMWKFSVMYFSAIVLNMLPARVSILLRVSSSDAIPKNTNAMQLERHITTTCYVLRQSDLAKKVSSTCVDEDPTSHISISR